MRISLKIMSLPVESLGSKVMQINGSLCIGNVEYICSFNNLQLFNEDADLSQQM